jgi:hypothetical protein
MTTTIIGQAVNATLGQVVYGERHPARGGVIVAVMDRALDLIDEPRRQLLRADNTGGVRVSCCLPRARHIALIEERVRDRCAASLVVTD